MTTLTPSHDSLDTLAADALVLGVTGDDATVSHALLGADATAAINAGAAALGAKAKAGSVTVLPGSGTAAKRVVLVGLGDRSASDVRYAAGEAVRACGKNPERVVLALVAADAADALHLASGEGALLGSYSFTDYKSDEPAPEVEYLLSGASDAVADRAKIIGAAVNGTRDLINTPPIDLFPASFAEIAADLAGQAGVDTKIWDINDLAEQGFGGLIGVGMGSPRLPRLVRVAWAPEGATETVALVGKGITFDSGGLSLKPPKGMETMKSDMSGAAAVLHTVIAAARANLAINVTGWLCLAENLPSGTAQRPSDVISIYGGKTVEVLNTDAEGRLVLADGLVKALEENPDVILDVATLTGAQGVALGSRTSGVMGVAAVRSEVVAAADDAGEAMWPMPLPEYLLKSFDSKVADLTNIGDPMGGMLSAGIFLQQFVGDAQWAHLDIARPAFNEGKAYGYTPSGGTGAAVRTLVTYLESRSRR